MPIIEVRASAQRVKIASFTDAKKFQIWFRFVISCKGSNDYYLYEGKI